MREHDFVGMAQRRHHMRGLAVTERVEAAAQGLAVHRNRRQSRGRGRLGERRRVAPESFLQRLGIDAVQDQPQARVGGRITQFETEDGVERLAMDADELVHLPIGIGAADHRDDRVEQHGREIEPAPFDATAIRDLA